jgi:hypothetical protein
MDATPKCQFTQRPLWVKMRNPQNEDMFSGAVSKSDFLPE